jgi:CheY-like chemotaxis protein/serine phosphatase RsbU (regulator of sigma subunit)/anti-sigma regulatory factor (Ser/Thr protein kinase)
MIEKNVSEIPSAEFEAQAQSLTLLIVEDDLMSREMLCLTFEGFFKRIVMAADGNEGFQLFCEHTPDIVLTDQIMPGLSGLDLMKKIRDSGAKTPVVLMTSSIDNTILLEAINTGVERFIPKPFDFDLIIRTLASIARVIVNERQLEQHRLQEVELLRYRDSYNSMQQESARRKERHVVRHDLRNQALEGAGGVRWGINVAYSPHDIMCGDGYSVRNLFDGRQLIFVVDAMGSGMSASLTAMLATSFFNYQVENLHLWETFTLRIFLKRFKEYLSSMLLAEEALSCGFFLVDLVKEEIKAALFGIPPLLVRDVNGSVRRIRGENPPIGIYPSETMIGTISLAGVADLMVMTDGVSDAPLTDGGSYREVLENDFREAPTLTAFQSRFKIRTAPEISDDMTLIHLRRLDLDSGWNWSGKPELTPRGLSTTIREFLDALARETYLGDVVRDELEVTLTEALTNAFEHGCLGIERDEKTDLQLSGEYDDALEKRAPFPGAAIELAASVWRGAGRPLLFMEVRDNGSGLPEDALSIMVAETSVNGRGLRMIRRFNDSLFIGRTGGCLIILKTLEEGDTHAH